VAIDATALRQSALNWGEAVPISEMGRPVTT